MNKSEKYIIADLGVIRKKGVNYFLDSHPWPVNDSEYHEFVECVTNDYSQRLLDCSDEVLFDISLVEMAFVSNLLHIMHYNFATEFCKENGIRFDSSEESNIFLHPNWTDIGNFYVNSDFPHGKSIRFIRRLVKNYVFNRHSSIFNFFKWIFKRSNVIGIGSFDSIKKEYINKQEKFCDHIDWPDLVDKSRLLFNKRKKNSEEVEEFTIKALEKIVYPFIKYLKEYDSKFTKSIDFESILYAWEKRFKDAYIIYSGLKLLKIPEKLLVTEVGKPFHKIISMSFSRSGCKVLSFSHGNDSALLNQKWLNQVLISHCNFYILETDEMCERFKRVGKNRALERKTLTQYLSLNSDIYLSLRNQYVEHPNKTDSIMVMGYPMNLYRDYDEAFMFFHYKLTLEYSLMDLLSKAGYSVIYKAHPDRVAEISGIIDEVVENIIIEPFERVWKEAGVLIFTYVSTTTFCYALNLPIPIVLIEHKDTPWNKGMRDVIEDRIEIVPADIVEGRVQIDSRVLLNAIETAKRKVNMDVAKKVTG